jgi:NADPH:quinone reductase-like Zn-dependent oxidoreductase
MELLPSEKAEDILFLAELADTGKFRPIIDRNYSLGQIVEAHAYVDAGSKPGNVVVHIEHRE